MTPKDGTKYYIPEGVTDKTIMDAIKHLQEIPDMGSKLAAFYSMYENKDDPYYIDFKDWGTPAGPDGSVSGGTIAYYSETAGRDVSSSAFEPFGNYIYGFVGWLGGIPEEALRYAASLTQSGASGWERISGMGDDVQDRPHVEAGIADAKGYMISPHVVFSIIMTECAY